jgi:cellulose synthase/poly-beta-1,6-N-acetylglucosamine synthase-like glycosyltransferase
VFATRFACGNRYEVPWDAISFLIGSRPLIVSANIPALNAAKIVRDCLYSLDRQSFSRDEMEIIVADNGSTDDTCAVVRAGFPSVRIVRASERGSGNARNAALAASSGRFICTIDADCVADEHWIEALVRALQAADDDVLCAGGAILPYRQKTLVEHYRPAWIQQSNLAKGNGTFTYAETPNAAFRREAFDRVGNFVGRHGLDDADMGARLTRAGAKFLYVPDAIVRHRNPVRLRDYWNQRRKYAQWNVTLANDHPDFIPPMRDSRDVQQLRARTVRRVAKNLLIELPQALLLRPRRYYTRLDPLLDCVAATAQYRGTLDALRQLQTTDHHPER